MHRWRSCTPRLPLALSLSLVVPLLVPVLAGTAGTATAAEMRPAPAGVVPGAVPGAVMLGVVNAVQGAVRLALTLRELADELRPPSYRLPVDAPVVRPFDAPDGPFGAGHRGVDLDAEPGTPVRAAERGRVRHAGQVAGVVWVSIDHEGGVRTSYGPVDDLRVRAGQDVDRGELIGRVAGTHHGDPDRDRGLHLGARRDGVYLDPMRLPGIGGQRPTLVDEGGWWGSGYAVTPYAAWGGGRLGGLLTSPSSRAVEVGYAVPPNPNHLVLVAGLSSTSGTVTIDPEHLGIGADGVTHFSYAGADLPYGYEHTWQGVEAAARLLEQQLREQARRQPGRPVDLVGHSLGGVIITYYLLHLHDPWDIGLPPVGHVVTVASPLAGSDLARAGVALVDGPVTGGPARDLWEGAGALPGLVGETARSLVPDAPSLRDVASSSGVLTDLAHSWEEALVAGAAGPLGAGTRVLNIVASLDGLVGADRAALDEAERRVLPGTHEGVLATEAVREVLWRFLAGREIVESPGALATHVGAWYGTGLTLGAVIAGDLAAAEDLRALTLPEVLAQLLRDVR